MFLIVGLGNPGAEYAGTRHNVGFAAADALHDAYGFGAYRDKFDGLISEGKIAGEKVYLLKPQTYMNLSGWSVMELCNWYKPEHDQLLLIYDDIDIPLGTIRIRGGGSSGTHNGMRSVIYQLGFDDFPRVRLGIGHADGQKGLIAHVLGAPEGEDREKLIAAIKLSLIHI